MLVKDAVETLTSTLPAGWRLTPAPLPKASGDGADAVAKITAPDGTSTWLVIEVKTAIEPRNVEEVSRQLTAYQRALGRKNSVPIVVAPFLARRTRERLEQMRIGYADLTGNVRLMSSRPGLFIATAGAKKRPWRAGKRSRSLRGAKAARIIRALCDWSRPSGIRELAQQTLTDPGYVSRIVDLLDNEALVDRDKGRIRTVDWEGLIRRWADDYSVFETNERSSYLAPRGLPSVLERLRTGDVRYTVTGSYAASKRAPVTAPRLLTMYADDPARVAEVVGLRQAEQGINVMLLKAFDPVVYDRTWELDGLRFAAASQIAVDLLTGSGREPIEAEALLKWMKENEPVWRA